MRRVAKLFIVLLTLVVVLLLAIVISGKISALVFINEFMPDPEGSDSGWEWVELYNDSDEVVSLTDFAITTTSASQNNRITTLPSSSISPQSFLIIVERDTLYEGVNKINVGTGGLNMYNDGVQISLKDVQGNIIDSLAYLNSSQGKSWERRGPLCQELDKHTQSSSIGSDNSNMLPSCWGGAEPPSLDPPPLVTSIEFSSDQVQWGTTLKGVGETNLFLRYSLDKETPVFTGNWYLEEGTEISNPFILNNYVNKRVKLVLQTELGNAEAWSEPISVYPPIQLSEFMPQPWINEPEWVEVYNPNDFSVDLSNYLVSNRVGEKFAFLNLSLKDSTGATECSSFLLSALSYCTFIFPENTFADGGDNTTITDEISLFADDIMLESISYAETVAGQSYSYDSEEWRADCGVTPDAENICPIEVDEPLSTLQISEIYPSPNSSLDEKEWVEVYNYGEKPLDLTGWYFREKGTGEGGLSSTVSHLPTLTLEPGDYVVVYDENLKVSLNNSGDIIYLFDQDGELIDSFVYNETLTGISNSRKFDDILGLYETNYEEDVAPQLAVPTAGYKNEFEEELKINYIDIASAKNSQDGERVGIIGVVSVEVDLLGETIFYIQDETSGIKVDLSSDIDFRPKVGQKVMLIGELDTSRNEREINILSASDISYQMAEQGEVLSGELNVIKPTVSFNWEGNEGRFAKVEGTIINNYPTSFDLDTIAGIIRVSILSSTGIDIPEKKKGDRVIATGILSQHDDLYRILPRYVSDLEIIPFSSALSIPTKKSSTTTKKTSTKTTTKTMPKVLTAKNTRTNGNTSDTIYSLGDETKSGEASKAWVLVLIFIFLVLALLFEELKRANLLPNVNLKEKLMSYFPEKVNITQKEKQSSWKDFEEMHGSLS